MKIYHAGNMDEERSDQISNKALKEVIPFYLKKMAFRRLTSFWFKKETVLILNEKK